MGGRGCCPESSEAGRRSTKQPQNRYHGTMLTFPRIQLTLLYIVIFPLVDSSEQCIDADNEIYAAGWSLLEGLIALVSCSVVFNAC